MREANIDGEREGWTHSPSEADMYLPPRVMDRRAHLGIGEMRERRAAPPAPGTRRARRHTRRWGMPSRHRAHSEHHSTEGPRSSPQRLPSVSAQADGEIPGDPPVSGPLSTRFWLL